MQQPSPVSSGRRRAAVSDARKPQVRSRLESVGICRPTLRLATKALRASDKPRLGALVERLTGIRERGICTGDQDACWLAVEAARDCLDHSGARAGDLDMLISSGVSPVRSDLAFHYEPPLSLLVKQAIGAEEAISFDVSNACAGMLTGLSILCDFIGRGTIRRGMVVSGEYISKLTESALPNVRSLAGAQLASLTVGDAGAAIIVERAGEGEEGIEFSELTTLADHADLCTGRPRRDGPGIVMHTDGRRLQEVATSEIVREIRRALERTQLDLDDIDWIIPHQTTVPAIRAGTDFVEQALGRSLDGKVVETVACDGNTASTSHFLALYELLEQKRARRGDRLMFLCLSAGLVVGVTIVTLDRLVEAYGRAH
jgi:3-oxoacyl-[acyl-carrier-protein] synthase-3